MKLCATGSVYPVYALGANTVAIPRVIRFTDAAAANKANLLIKALMVIGPILGLCFVHERNADCPPALIHYVTAIFMNYRQCIVGLDRAFGCHGDVSHT